MEKKNYITNIEHEKCKKAAKAYAELEQEDIILVDVTSCFCLGLVL